MADTTNIETIFDYFILGFKNPTPPPLAGGKNNFLFNTNW